MATKRPLLGILVGGLLLSAAAGAAGCAATLPPAELVQARNAYSHAQAGPAATLAPADLDTAKQALRRAERAFDDEPDDVETRDLAYIALRRAQMADTQGRIGVAMMNKQQAERDMKVAQGQLQDRTLQQLSETKVQLDARGRQLASERQQFGQQISAERQRADKTAAELEAERKARLEAEQKATDAMNALSKLTMVRQDVRGTVITLNGSVLFASGQSMLLPTAQERLNQVGDALKDKLDREIVVEGHTDSQGGLAYNQELSYRRALAVRDYLVSRGVPADKIRAVGHAYSRPIADNASPEGRANNRRVEIVIPPSASAPNSNTPR